QKQRLFANIAEDIRDVPEQIQRRQFGLFLKVDPAYGKGVADALDLKLDCWPDEAPGPLPR
ncbi:catalase-related domain-containing protein, partial [Pseudomonas aeruginosa]|uniref:catalase-related domain-containing protein n=1 Tax=Pseudomonas aeruginosa TaxID=287 RepID=UPI003CC551A4